MSYQFDQREYLDLKRAEWLPSEQQLSEFFPGVLKSSNYRASLVTVISSILSDTRPRNIVDVGSGSGEISFVLKKLCPKIEIVCCDKFVRQNRVWEGNFIHANARHLPFSDSSFDVAILCNLLHHDSTPQEALREAARVARERIIIKDHLSKSKFDLLKLKVLDLVGNLRPKDLGLSLTGKYLSISQWKALFDLPTISAVTMIVNTPFRSSPWSTVFSNQLEVFFDVRL